jgi:hypothetical protein
VPGPGGGGHRLERTAEPVVLGRGEGVGDRAAGRVVDQDVDRAELLLGQLEQPGRRVRVGQVSLDRHRAAARRLDLGHDRPGVLGPVIAVFLRGAGIDRIIEAQVGAQDRASAPGQRRSGRGADAVVGSRHERGMPSHRNPPQSGDPGRIMTGAERKVLVVRPQPACSLASGPAQPP